jgi:Raf kinase inhibitor-like YbhB/YbcL family protein
VTRVASALTIALVLVAGLGACDSGSTEKLPELDATRKLSVTGPFKDGDRIPEKYTCDGAGVAPALEWTVVPEVREYALIVSDPDAPGGTFVHWVVWGLPPTGHLAEGRLPEGAAEGAASSGDRGYVGPCPPEGDEPHRYEWTVYALRLGTTVQLKPGAKASELLEALKCCVAAIGTLTGTYAR